MRRTAYHLLIAICLLGGWAALVPQRSVAAATLSVSPPSGSFAVGQNISVSVLVSATDQAINAISGTLSFPPAQLQATSISKAGSITNLWPEEPNFSNTSGRIQFEGIVLNPGFTGTAGKVLTINFKVKAGISADITFLSGAVLANDGQGTNVLEASRGARYSLGAVSIPALPPKASAPDTYPPEAFTITKLTTDETDPQPVLSFSAKDAGSGIAGYDIKIDSGEWSDAAALSTSEGSYRLPLLAPGSHHVAVRARDKAGNTIESDLDISITPIQPPVISEYTQDPMLPRQAMAIQGQSLPDATILLSISSDKTSASFSARADEHGEWSAVFDDPLPLGTYELTAVARDARGAVSLKTSPLPVNVRSWAKETVTAVRDYTLVIGATSISFALILALIAFLYHRLRKFQKAMLGQVALVDTELKTNEMLIERRLAEEQLELKKLESAITGMPITPAEPATSSAPAEATTSPAPAVTASPVEPPLPPRG